MDADSDDEEGEPLLHLRLKKVQRDLRHVISHDQRIIALQRLEESKQMKEEEDARKKIEEEEAKKKAAEKPEGAEDADKPTVDKPAEEEKKAAAAEEEKDSDASPEEDDIVDVDNLPEDRTERLLLIGVDQSLIDEGGEILDMVEMSAMEEFTKTQDRKKEA